MSAAIESDVIYPPKHTPWGAPHGTKQFAPGVWSYTTSSHGGFYVSPTARQSMPEQLRNLDTYAGEGWYEEDCDWAIVALAFPGVFDGRSLHYAFAMANHKHSSLTIDLPAYLATPTGAHAKAKSDEWYDASRMMFEFGVQCGGADGCSGSIHRIDGGLMLEYRSDKWPNLACPFTLEQAQAAGLTVTEEVVS